MFEIRVVLERVGRGESRSEVECVTGHTRKTIGRYVKRAEQLGWRPGVLVTNELAGAVARASSVTRERVAGDSELLRSPHQERIRAWLTPSPTEKRGLRWSKVQQLLEREGVIDATRARDPKGKPHVERGIQYVRESFFRGERWLNRDQVQREALRWCLETAGTRVHGTTRQRPLAVFENVERAALQPLTAERFDPPVWSEYTVHPDHSIVVNKGL